MASWRLTKNIELGPLKITGGSAMIVIGIVAFYGSEWLSKELGGSPMPVAGKVAISAVLVAAGIVWFFVKSDGGGDKGKK